MTLVRSHAGTGPGPGHRPQWTTSAILALAGGCWVAQTVVPWTGSGVLSHADTASAVRLIRSGALDAVLPGWIGAVLLLLPAAGAGLLALSAVPGVAAARSRVVLATSAVTVSLVLATILVGLRPGSFGPGAWLTTAGAVAGAAGAAREALILRSRHRAAGRARPGAAHPLEEYTP